MRTGGTHSEYLNIVVSPGGRASRGGVAPKGSKSILYKVMLHIKSKVMKSRIQWCKNFAPGACLGVTRGQRSKNRILDPVFLLSHNSSKAF